MSVEEVVKALQEEVKTLQSEIHLLQRQQSSRRGEPGPTGARGSDGRDGTNGRDGSAVTKAEATEIIRNLVQHDEAFIAALGEIAMKEFKRRMVARLDEMAAEAQR